MLKKNIFKEKSQEDDFLKKNNLFQDEHLTVDSYYFKPGQTFPMHRHPEGSQTIIVIRGSGEFYIQEKDEDDARTIIIRDGDVLFVPAGAWHGATNIGETVLIVAQVTSAEPGMETQA